VIDADAVLLDLYDTVADGAWGDLARIVIDRIGVDRETLFRAFDETRPARSIGAFGSAEGDMAAVITACGVEPDPAMIRELVALEMELLPARARLYDDSLPVVSALRDHGIRTALISNCSHSTRPIVDALGLPSAFDGVALSFEVGAAKPDPEIYRAALELAGGAPPERSAFVDDQVPYCDGAAALGMRTFLIVRDDAEPMEGKPSSTNGHQVIRDLRALLD
jgi:putative hydrolase of the HAD superfamily